MRTQPFSLGARDLEASDGKPRVLLAEDDAAFRATMSLLLQADGYDVVEAADGSEALDALVLALSARESLQDFDIIVSDVRMPGFSGMDVLRALQGIPEAPPLILMTAFGGADTRRDADRLGAATVLNKPFDLDELRAAVTQALECRTARVKDRKSAAGS